MRAIWKIRAITWPFEVAGESLFCIRGRDGVIRTFYNVCQHRAHQLLQGAGTTRVVVCPYHAWTYELTGRLRGAPNTQGGGRLRPLVDLPDRGAHRGVLGFVFVNLDPDATDGRLVPRRARGTGAEYVPHWADLKPLEWVEIPENCNWKVSVENYSECYHCTLNHPTFATGVIKPETYDIQPQPGLRAAPHDGMLGIEKMSYDIDRDSNEHAGDYRSWFLWPMFSFQVYPGNVLNTYHWRPDGLARVTVWRGWYTENGEDRGYPKACAAGPRDDGGRGYPPCRVGPARAEPAAATYRGRWSSIRPAAFFLNTRSATLQQWMREAVDG
jgi:phenylpropionate dioxygenase-like ring-hydroxylating dioxygenase large terminal subunit